jgi:hypothetical protein
VAADPRSIEDLEVFLDKSSDYERTAIVTSDGCTLLAAKEREQRREKKERRQTTK